MLTEALKALMTAVLHCHEACVLVMHVLDAVGGSVCELDIPSLQNSWVDDTATVMETWLEIMNDKEAIHTNEETDIEMLQLAVRCQKPTLQALMLEYCGKRSSAAWKRLVLETVFTQEKCVTDSGYAELCNCIADWFAEENDDDILTPYMPKLRELSERWSSTNFSKRRKTDSDSHERADTDQHVEDAAQNLVAFIKYKDEVMK